MPGRQPDKRARDTSLTPSPSVAGAFFDVDETLIRFKSMARFLAFYLAERAEPRATFERLTGSLRVAARSGVPRDEINRRYYRLYAGESARKLSLAGERWLAHERLRGEVFHLPVRDELRAHRQTGHDIVLISGSFFACLEPIACEVQADRVFGTQPVIRDGVLTGEIVEPVIDTAKGDALRGYAGSRGLPLEASHAYGDHASDLPMLTAVGHPVAVGDDRGLLEHAVAAGWRVLATLTRRPYENARPLSPAGS